MAYELSNLKLRLIKGLKILYTSLSTFEQNNNKEMREIHAELRNAIINLNQDYRPQGRINGE